MTMHGNNDKLVLISIRGRFYLYFISFNLVKITLTLIYLGKFEPYLSLNVPQYVRW